MHTSKTIADRDDEQHEVVERHAYRRATTAMASEGRGTLGRPSSPPVMVRQPKAMPQSTCASASVIMRK